MIAPASRVRRQGSTRFIVVTGLSGAGKSQAIRALEDLGYFCVDNLPVALLPFMAEFAQQHATEHDRIAVVMDVREPRFISDFPAVYRALRKSREMAPTLIFLDRDFKVRAVLNSMNEFTDAKVLGEVEKLVAEAYNGKLGPYLGRYVKLLQEAEKLWALETKMDQLR